MLQYWSPECCEGSLWLPKFVVDHSLTRRIGALAVVVALHQISASLFKPTSALWTVNVRAQRTQRTTNRTMFFLTWGHTIMKNTSCARLSSSDPPAFKTGTSSLHSVMVRTSFSAPMSYTTSHCSPQRTCHLVLLHEFGSNRGRLSYRRVNV